MNKDRFLVTKLGTAKGQERSRIWIEGQRLANYGFMVGKYFHRTWTAKTLTLALAKDDDVMAAMPSKVSGKGAHPIIDITGACVRDTFGAHGTHVQCKFYEGRIEIERQA